MKLIILMIILTGCYGRKVAVHNQSKLFNECVENHQEDIEKAGPDEIPIIIEGCREFSKK